MRMIADILTPTSGAIYYDGTEIRRMGAAYRDIFGFLPQDFGYYPSYTAAEFLMYISALKGIPKKIAKKRSRELLEEVGLSDVADKKIRTFSGGMKQRVGIAQALLNQPDILILDEPTAGLDPKERVRFRNLLSDYAGDKIVILSTHIVSDVEHIADNIVLMDKGRLLEQDKCNRLIEKKKGCVWSMDVKNEDVLEYTEKYKVVNTINIDRDHVRIRIIGDEKPEEEAQSVYPTLEDVYMYHFGSDD